MCGRFVLSDASWAGYHAALSIIQPIPTAISFNIKPTQEIPIAYIQDDVSRASVARWWFVPHWFRGDVKEWKQTTFNARIETAHEKPTFRTAWRQNRCVIPASGYYEWTGPKGNKTPHFIHLEQNAPVFFFAGLWSRLSDGAETCAIVTRAADPQIADLHDRMPVILTAEELERWLKFSDDDQQVIASYGTGWSGKYRTYPVRPFGIKEDGPDLIERDGFDL